MQPLKVLVLHNRYQQPGGEDEVFAQEVRLLRRMGHTVIEYEDTNDRLHQIGAVPGLLRAMWSSETVDRLRLLWREARPDVAHFHNTFAMISPAAYYACRKARVPVVQTLHNYRTGCANAYCAIDGSPCERCVSRSIAWPGIVRKCYRGSRSATAGVAAITAAHKAIGTYRRKVDAYISTTDFARRIHIRSGIPRSRVFVKPNFVEPPSNGMRQSRGYGLYVGRLAQEKGIDILLDAWQKVGRGTRLLIAGEGESREAVCRAAAMNPAIEWVGQRQRTDVTKLMLEAGFLIHPSRLYEGCGMVIVEAFSAGLPCIVSGQGSLGELVEDGRTGLHFCSGDAMDLARKIDWMLRHPHHRDQMGAAVQAHFQARFTPERNYGMLMEIYQAAIHNSRQEDR